MDLFYILYLTKKYEFTSCIICLFKTLKTSVQNTLLYLAEHNVIDYIYDIFNQL